MSKVTALLARSISLLAVLGIAALSSPRPIDNTTTQASQGVIADSQVRQAVDLLVRQGAVILTKTDSSGAKVIEVRLLGKQFDNGVIEHLRLFPDLETLRCLDTRVDDAFIKRLDEFPRLRVLGFFNAAITDAGLIALANSKVSGE
ncbi:MAG: hypothetical protein M3X11_03890 [Acidobacteriota bacterium]|nr:hypothetical protein [Acidobacteriota bacterium]